jgi:hypothetical protein
LPTTFKAPLSILNANLIGSNGIAALDALDVVVGARVGTLVGLTVVGIVLGVPVGDRVGLAVVGIVLGVPVGDRVGLSVGLAVVLIRETVRP